MNSADFAWIIAPSAIFGIGVIDDLRTRKFHNWLFIACVIGAFAVVISTGGLAALEPALLGFAAGIAFCLPLVLLRVLGAGDMKLLAAAGILIGWSAVFQVLILSIVWGGLFGVLKAFFGGKLPVMARNLARIVTLQALQNKARATPHELTGESLPESSPKASPESMELTRIPFTVALLLGWMSQLMLQGKL